MWAQLFFGSLTATVVAVVLISVAVNTGADSPDPTGWGEVLSFILIFLVPVVPLSGLVLIARAPSPELSPRARAAYQCVRVLAVAMFVVAAGLVVALLTPR